MVEFFEFLMISKPLVMNMTAIEIKKCWIFHSQKRRKKMPKNNWHATFILLGLCYQHLYPHYYLHKKRQCKLLNTYFLDYETETLSYQGTDQILIWNDKKEAYLFTTIEIMNLLHTSLSNSEAILDVQFMICSIIKSFRLPTNPYTGKSFTLTEMKQIVGQLLLGVVLYDTVSTIQYPELFLYLCHFQDIYRHCPSEEKRYEMTQYLERFFSQHHLHFQEKFKINVPKKTCENQSKWKSSLLPKQMQFFTIWEHL